MKAVAVAVAVVAAVIQVMARPAEGTITCGQVKMALAPCMPYLTSQGGTPPPGCCAGVKAIETMATNAADKQVACSCIKEAAAEFPNVRDDSATQLPGKCGAPLDFPISPNFDCKR
ncbi:hypothetical protein Nepgr_026789 [Nepenthes gracilis]|uniref:Non-specific lipid-transfer protein n=1 Tax=Nepenthes gracilis TaxID=150966 RepID=A0AAD3Y2V4_NEPGR|nr:hypothetical protein Nepgr_026789 [Nepenthes gracilis]